MALDLSRCVPDNGYMRNRLRAPFSRAARLATASIVDVARGMGKGYRTVKAYQRGDRRVTPESARRLAAYLRERARAFNRAADQLDRAAEEDEQR